jgi:hypothetical protein
MERSDSRLSCRLRLLAQRASGTGPGRLEGGGACEVEGMEGTERDTEEHT